VKTFLAAGSSNEVREKGVEEDTKKRGMKMKKREFFNSKAGHIFSATCCVLLLNVLFIRIYSEHVIAFGT